MSISPITLAEVVLEVAEFLPDIDNNIPRAEWRWDTVEKAIEIIKACNITPESEDIDEIVTNYLCQQEALS